jgi:REP element-mobilizing transposase RayT
MRVTIDNNVIIDALKPNPYPDARLPKRKSIRLHGHDYSGSGYYFITICVKDRRPLFGNVVGTTAPGRPTVELTPIGQCVAETIRNATRNNVEIDKYVVMPNHVHVIVILRDGADDRGRSSLQQVVRNIKSFATKRAGYSLWQPRYHDHIIRNEDEYQRIWRYIDENPVSWCEDRYYVV